MHPLFTPFASAIKPWWVRLYIRFGFMPYTIYLANIWIVFWCSWCSPMSLSCFFHWLHMQRIICLWSGSSHISSVKIWVFKSLWYVFIDFSMFPCRLDFQLDQTTRQIFNFNCFFNEGISSHSISVSFGPAFPQMFCVNIPIHNMFNDTSFCRCCWFL